MNNIDFLPSSYREQYDQRRAALSRLVLVVALAIVVGLASYSQHSARRKLMAELEESQLLHKQASTNQTQLAELESKLHRARAISNLVTYLRHPWPRTKILSSLLDPIPPEITLEKIQITRETPQSTAMRRGARPTPTKEDSPTALDDTAAARQDLKDLRSEIDPGHTVISISGTTRDNNALHLYLVKLGHSRLLRDPQLKSVDSSPSEEGVIRFVATVRIKPGHGQPEHRPEPEADPPTMAQWESQP